MDSINTTKTLVKNPGNVTRSPIEELETIHQEELQRIHLQHLEKIRQIESGRIQAEKELEQLEDKFAELGEKYRAETIQLNSEIIKIQQSTLDNRKSLADVETTLLRVENQRDNLDQERRGLLERLRTEETKKAEIQTRLESEKNQLTEQLNQLSQDLTAATEYRQRLKIAQARLKEQVTLLENQRNNLGQEKHELQERLRTIELQGVEERKKLEGERNFYRQAMISAEQQLDFLSKGFLHQLGRQLDLGWKGIFGLPALTWSALWSARSTKDSNPDAWLDQLEEVLTQQGAKAAENFVRRKCTEPAHLATGLTRLARKMSPDHLDAALPLAQEAAQIDPRPFRRKWLAFMYFDAGDIDNAQNLLASLPESAEFKPSERKKADHIADCYYQRHGHPPLPENEPTTIDLSPIPFAPKQSSLTDEQKQLLDQKLKAAMTQGMAALQDFIAAQCDSIPKSLRSFCQLRAAQVALDAGAESEALELAETVLNQDNTVTNLRSATRIFYNAARLERAEELADILEDKLGLPKPNDRKFINEVKGRAQLARWAAQPAQARTTATQPRKVLNILAFSLPYTSVGYATRSHGLAVGIKNAGWDIRPYTRPGFPYDFKTELEGQALPQQDEIDGILYQRLFDFNRKGMNEVEYLHAAIAHYERIIRQEEPAVVHAASNYVTALPALIAARRLGVPFIYEVRGFWEITRSSRDEQFEHTAKYRFMQLFEALTARHADHVITITSAMQEELMARGVPEERIAIAYNSVDPQRFIPHPRNQALAQQLGIPDGIPIIGYVGSFVDYEGLDDLVIACTGLKADGYEFRLLLVGDGDAFNDLKHQIEASGLTDKTIMTGRVPHEMVEDYYSLIDIAPFPRKPWEVCELVSPLKPYEAMALEKAVVVSGTRALCEIVNHEGNGLVFAKGETNDLQAKLAILLRDNAMQTALGKRARQWIKQERSWDVAGQSCIDIYTKLGL